MLQPRILATLPFERAPAGAPLAQNPFIPLLEVYEAGAYPFVLSAGEVVLFSFGSAAGTAGS